MENENIGSSMIETANKNAEEMEKENLAREIRLNQIEETDARASLGATADAGAQPKQQISETDEEYTERFLRGEVNPMKDDGDVQ